MKAGRTITSADTLHRWGEEVRNVSVLVAIGVSQDGMREVLGVAEGMKEDKSSWLDFLRWLKGRGLNGTRLFISDCCLGLVEALGECFPEAAWQRCIVHFYRNIFSAMPSTKAMPLTFSLALLVVGGCGHWVEERQGPTQTALADRISYRVTFRHHDYEFTEDVHSPSVTESETDSALAQEAFWIDIQTTANPPVIVARWDGKPGYRPLVMQRFQGVSYAVLRQFDPHKAIGWLHFMKSVTPGGEWEEVDPKNFPGFLAFPNVTSHEVTVGLASATPWTEIARAQTEPFPYFDGELTGAIWDAVMTGSKDADYSKRPGYEERLREFKRLYGKVPVVP